MLLAHTNTYITIPPDNDAPGHNSLVWGPLAPCTFPLLPTQYSNASHNTHPTILPTQYSRECVAKRERHTAGAPAETMSHGGTAKEVTLCFFSPHPLLCYLFPAHPRALPYPMGTSSDPASLPYYLAAFCITNYSKTALAKRPTRCLNESATPVRLEIA